MADIKIKLGDHEFEVAPLTFKSLRVLLPAISKSGNSFETPEGMDNLADIIVAAVGVSYPALNREMLDNMAVTPTQLLVALGQIMQVSGLVEMRETVKMGEALAGRAGVAEQA